MTEPRFLQIHTLHSYTATLLNRDDSGLAKRLPYGGAIRTRISSQCLKRHWRKADDPHALSRIDGTTEAFRSRELVTRKIIDPIRKEFSDGTIAVLDNIFQTNVYGDKGTSKSGRQTLLFGEPELNWLAKQALELAPGIEAVIREENIAASPEGQKEQDKWKKGCLKATEEIAKEWKANFKKNIDTMREQTTMHAGLTSALFGRMVTSDPDANIDAPVHVAHAFTVHDEESESDYFTAIDDLKRDEDDGGADTIQETELTSGLYYGYVVVDVPGLVSNVGGNENRSLAAEVVHNLIYLIAETSPGAKLGSTAPYGRAELLLAEFGNRQPRSLAGAYRNPIRPDVDQAQTKLASHLAEMDQAYETGEDRRVLHFGSEIFQNLQRGSIREIAEWARNTVREGANI